MIKFRGENLRLKYTAEECETIRTVCKKIAADSGDRETIEIMAQFCMYPDHVLGEAFEVALGSLAEDGDPMFHKVFQECIIEIEKRRSAGHA